MDTKIKKLNFSNITQYLNILCVIIVTAVFTAINPNFIGSINIKNILTDTAPLLLMSMGVTFVLLLGSIDLSTGSVCTFACVITGMYIGDVGMGILLLIVLLGVFAGLLNGILYTQLKVPSFIATLCTSAIWQCAALLLSGGAPKGIPIKQWNVIAWAKISVAGIPILFIISLVCLAILWFFQNYTTMGKTIFAVGANERAARMIGLKINTAKLVAFTLSGLGSALSGAMYAIKLKSSLPTVGNSLNLLAIAAVALGGTSLSGGKGSVLKTLIGVLLVTIIQNGLNVIGVDAFWQQIVFGILVIVAIYLNSEKGIRDLVVK